MDDNLDLREKVSLDYEEGESDQRFDIGAGYVIDNQTRIRASIGHDFVDSDGQTNSTERYGIGIEHDINDNITVVGSASINNNVARILRLGVNYRF